MIKNKEIRVGNYLEWNKIPFKVCAIFRNVTENELWAKDNSELHPILLTEEILLKCGGNRYVDNGKVNIDLEITTDLYFHFDINGTYLICLGDEVIKVNNLHELQNLYFALSGEELEIKQIKLNNN